MKRETARKIKTSLRPIRLRAEIEKLGYRVEDIGDNYSVKNQLIILFLGNFV